jgi:23S rRNA (pseudouridine1915-N3)-methyltransferase
MPAWVSAGFQEYATRLPADYQLRLIEIPALNRTKSTDIKRVLEGEMLLKARPSGAS